MMTTIAANTSELATIERLLYQEATYLDKADLDSWLTLYTEDGTYWMPVVEDQEDPINHVSLFYDDRVMMEIRKRNFVHPRAASKDHKVRSSHIIANIRIEAKDDATGNCTVGSNFQAMQYYRGEKVMYGGTYTHELIAVDESYKIKSKRVDLINCDAPHKSIIMYL